MRAAKLPEKLSKHIDLPGSSISAAERAFLQAVHDSAKMGVGYGWMQQVIEWVWQEAGPGAWGPEYFYADKAEAVETERERCAAIAENFPLEWVHISAGQDYVGGNPAVDIAAAIRTPEDDSEHALTGTAPV